MVVADIPVVVDNKVRKKFFLVIFDTVCCSYLSSFLETILTSLLDHLNSSCNVSDHCFDFIYVCDRNDYLVEAERQLSDTKVYRDVSNTESILSKLSKTSNRMFSSLKGRGFLTEKQMKYFTYEFQKATNFGKL